jgi:hypothetical protein
MTSAYTQHFDKNICEYSIPLTLLILILKEDRTISALKKLRKEDQEFKGSLGFKTSSRHPGLHKETMYKKKKKKERKMWRRGDRTKC